MQQKKTETNPIVSTTLQEQVRRLVEMRNFLTKGAWWRRSIGGLMVGAGIMMDGALGLKLLKGITWQNILFHLLITLIWAMGMQLSTAHPWQAISKMSRRAIGALIFVLCTFPASGLCICSGAICLMPEIWKDQGRAEQEAAFVALPEIPQELSPAFDQDISPSTEALRDSTIDAGIQQDLIDPFPIQQSEPDNEALALDLLEEYERCVYNSTQDQESRQASLEQARDLLLQLLWRDNQNASLWIRLARIRCESGDLTTALQDALYALQLQPRTPDYAILAMNLAFRLHAWDALVNLIRDEAEQPEELPPSLQSLTWYTTRHTENA